jgi:murein DD-endopeptidase MepM/ murein hydrolase activator NlpD
VAQATDFVDLSRRVAMVDAVIDAEETRVRDHQAAKRRLGNEMHRLALDLDRSRAALAFSTGALQQADADLVRKALQMDAVQTGIRLVSGGFLFPVAGPHNFSDTFGAPRMIGTAFAHFHEGTDVFAAEGTPLVAVERGVLVNVGTDTLGGMKLWLVGASGNRYYYAHLSGFAPGVVHGKVVAAGEVVGYVGTSGNAQGTSAHLHFEVHPGGGPAINPFPLLKIADEALRRAAPVS